MIREQKNIYCFIFDENNSYYRAKQNHDGSYAYSKNSSPYPISYNPINLLTSKLEFATNMEYSSMVRAIDYPLDFIKDGAAILRNFYHLGKRVEQKLYFTIIEWNGTIYDLSYTGQFDFSEKKEDPKTGMFTVPLMDNSAWGILSKVDKVKFAIDCSEHNPASVRVLIDGITLVNTFNYQTVQAPILGGFNDDQLSHTIPFVLVNQDGDSSGLISRGQSYSSFPATTYIPPNNFGFLESIYNVPAVNFKGSFVFRFANNYADPFRPYDVMRIYFSTSLGKRFDIFKFGVDGISDNSRMVSGNIYTANFDFDWDLESGEKVFFAGVWYNTEQITPIVTNIFVKVKTVPQPKVVYGLRGGDLLKQLVNVATNGKHTIGSEFFEIFNKDICISGDALRSIPNSQIYTSFADFFKTFDSLYWMALRSINGLLWMEQFKVVYNNNGTVRDLGEAIDVQLTPANEFYCNEIQVGSPNQDMRHPSGRLEFNSTNTFSTPILSSSKKLDLVTEYITGCYAIQFLLLDYEGDNTTDNKGDKSVYLLDITDDQGTAVDDIETFENININNASLEPIIKSPLNNDVINFNKPVIRGIAEPGSTVNIYCDTVLDGSAVSDADGNWSYSIVTNLQSFDLTHTGVHNIDATYTDLLGVLSSIVIIVNTTIACNPEITYPKQGDNLYNNKPLIKGRAQKDQNIDIVIDRVLVHSTVSDASCKWEYKSDALFNGDHTLEVLGKVVNFHTDTNVEHPLITYVGSELDGFVIINNLPLVEGVAKPFEMVTVFLNYISYANLGTVQADANGNWSLQVTPVTYIDPNSGNPVILAPIQNGVNVFSTSLTNYTVGINVLGYKLNRPNYDTITGVVDNSVFNTRYSPKRMLESRYSLFAAMLKGQPQEFIYFQTAAKNANLITRLGTEVVSERANISTSELGEPFAILEWATVKVKALKSFIASLSDFNNGGIIKFKFRGKTLYALAGIGSMKLNSIIDTEQEWKLLLSTLTSYIDLLNLYNNGLTIKLDNMSFYRSDRNSLHFVEYDFQKNQKYHSVTMYQDWFNNRNDFYAFNPDYIHKFQRSETNVRDQIIARGVTSAALKMYRCIDASFVDAIPYNPVNPAPIPAPEVVLEAIIDFSAYPAGQYFFILFINDERILIAERVETRDYWPKTLLIEASSSINQVDAFYSTGFKTIIRIEGIIKKAQPEINAMSVSDDIGNSEMLYSSNSRSFDMRYGTAYGLPDYVYLKIADAITLDEVKIDNNFFVLAKDEKMIPEEYIEGHPLYHYGAKFTLRENKRGLASLASDGVPDNGSVILVVNAEAFGLPRGSLININLTP